MVHPWLLRIVSHFAHAEIAALEEALWQSVRDVVVLFDHDELRCFSWQFLIWVGAQEEFGPLEGFAYSMVLWEKEVVEVFCHCDGGLVVNLLVLLDTNHVLNTSEVEQYAGELRVTGRKKHELQWGVEILD